MEMRARLQLWKIDLKALKVLKPGLRLLVLTSANNSVSNTTVSKKSKFVLNWRDLYRHYLSTPGNGKQNLQTFRNLATSETCHVPIYLDNPCKTKNTLCQPTTSILWLQTHRPKWRHGNHQEQIGPTRRSSQRWEVVLQCQLVYLCDMKSQVVHPRNLK